MLCGPDGELPEKLRNLEPRLIEHVSNEIMDRDPNVRWDDIGNFNASNFIWHFNFMAYYYPGTDSDLLSYPDNVVAGLEHAKKCVTEMVIWPLLRPDIFKGCRSPGRGLLLFGPPVSTESFYRCLHKYCWFIIYLSSCHILGNGKNNDWESHSWRGKSNIFLHIC